MERTYTTLGIEGISREAVFNLMMPLVELSAPEDQGEGSRISMAGYMDGVVLEGELLVLLGESLAMEASVISGGKASFATSSFANHCIARFERGRSIGRTEVSNYDVIEDSLGLIDSSRDHADSGDLFIDFELEWVFGEYPRKLNWRHYEAKLS